MCAQDRQPRRAATRARRRLLIGVDLGKVTTAIALGEVAGDGDVHILRATSERHRGEPLRAFVGLYQSLARDAIGGVVATGAFSERFGSPVLAGLPTEIAQEHALRHLYPDDGPVNVVRIGGSGYSVLTRDAHGRTSFESNDRCSAGTGAAIEALCERLGHTLEEAVGLAKASPTAVPVTSRCSVFAKSELTHFANQGEPHGALLRGYFASVAHNVFGLYDRVKVAGPVILIGNGARIEPLREELARLVGVGVPLTVAPQAGVFEALGALYFAGQTDWPAGNDWPAEAAALLQPARTRITVLPPVEEQPGSVVHLREEGGGRASTPTTPGVTAAPGGAAVLGLDLGSTGAKGVLLDLATGTSIADVYRRTDGNPIEAAKALIARLRSLATNPVVAVGLTGSGRDAVATVFRGAYPDIGSRLVVENEIVAHATAAMRLDPDRGRSLSIVEIGGQDAKFINVKGGHIVESDMNRVCSAGTGSFLEEQAVAHGLDDISRFGELAAAAQRPPDLGQMCTVFVGDLVDEALSDGYRREDVFAGLQYSVIRNYKNRVMGNRRFLEKVFFQGKPAENPSLARTLAAVTGREVIVPANPGAMGAIGIALLAAEQARPASAARAKAAAPAQPAAQPAAQRVADEPAVLELERVLSAQIESRRQFRCHDASCRAFCRLEAATVVVDGARYRVVSGGNCPKYEAVSAGGRKLPKEAPDPYRERQDLLAQLLAEVGVTAPRVTAPAPSPAAPSQSDPRAATAAAPPGPRLGLPYTHYLVDLLPFFATFFARLGARVEVLWPDARALADGDRLCAAAASCTPVKILHGLAAREDLDFVFLPKIVNMPPDREQAGAYTCPMAQGAPGMVEQALRAAGRATRVLRPVLSPRRDEDVASLATLRRLAQSAGYGASPADMARLIAARRAGLAAQRRYREGLRAIGARALHFARQHDYPVVLMVGETHVVHDPLLNSGIHEIVAANGALALPLDCFAVPDEVPPLQRVHWSGAGATLRAAVAAQQRGDVFPLLLGAYGCGPNSFVEHLFNDLLEDYPHAVLESDGHGGKAGYVTRVQAFLHSVRGYREAARERGAGEPREASRQGGRLEGSPAQVVGPTPATLAARLQRYDTPVPRSLNGNRGRPMYFGNIGGRTGRQVAAAMRGAGLDVTFVGATGPRALAKAHEGCSGKECLPYQLIWGTLAAFLEDHPPEQDGQRPIFVSVGRGFEACRANVFPLAEQLSLERLGLGGFVEVADFTLLFEDWALTSVVWMGLVAVDLLNMMRFYHLASETERGQADATFERYADRLTSLLERPRTAVGSRARWAETLGVLDEVGELLSEAARAFGRLTPPAARAAHLRDVFLCGDLYLRVDEWGNGDLQRKLADQGLRPIFEPFAEFFELLALHDVQQHGLTSKLGAKRAATLRFMRFIVERLLNACRVQQPWMFWQDVRAIERASRRLFDGYPFGETIPTIGSALLAWRGQPVDGVVVVSPRGCGPALIAEAELRRQADFPLLFVYNDGDPIDEERLAGFAWRLRGQPARRQSP